MSLEWHKAGHDEPECSVGNDCPWCRIAELEGKLERLEKAIAIAAMNLPCSTEQCQLDVKAGLQAAREKNGDG